MKLISNTLFGKYCKSKEKEFSRRIDYLDWYEKTRNNFDNFLEQPLKLEMFVPCDNDEEILKPQYIAGKEVIYNELVEEFIMDKVKEYNDAKKKVLFKGIEIFKGTIYMCSVPMLKVKDLYQTTIEDLIHYEPILTENAVKQIRL